MYLGGVCFITDRKSSSLTCHEMTLLCLKAGVKWVQYREKEKTRLEYYHEARHLREMTKDFPEAAFIVNDYVDIALSVDADGVHLGQDDLPIKEARRLMGRDKIIGISTHGIAEALEAEKAGADYIGFGPVFHTETKDAGRPRGTEALREIVEAVSIPVVAIGGINLKNLSSVLESGAHAVAVSSAILKGDIEVNASEFLRVVHNFPKIM